MLNILDKYIIKKYLGTFFFVILLMLSISIVIDISERIEDFLESEATLTEIVFEYYVGFIINIGILLSPLFTFITVIYFTSRMAYRSELIAILGSGVSFRRMLLPYFMATTILTALFLVSSHFFVPMANKGRIAFENVHIKNPYVNRAKNIHLQIDPQNFIYMENYNTKDSVGYKFAIEVIKEGQLVKKLRADRIKWDEEKGLWTIVNYYVRDNQGLTEKLYHGQSLDTVMAFKPAMFARRTNYKETMTTPELSQFIATEYKRGVQNLSIYQVELHKRTSVPLATFILTLMGATIASRKVRGGSGLHIAIGICLGAIYVLFMQISSTMSTHAGLSPMVGVWIPNMVFLAGALLIYRFSPK